MKLLTNRTPKPTQQFIVEVRKMSLDVNISEPDEFNCTELHTWIETVAKINKIDNLSYHVDMLCGKGQNYIANVFRVSIKGTDSDCCTNTSVIFKTLINTARQELFGELHNRKVIAYRDVIDKYYEIQNNFRSADNIFLPKCIFSSTSKNNEVIVLEDLVLKGFNVDNKLANYEKLDFTRVKLVITELAKFHALSFVFEVTDENFENVRNSFKDIIFDDNFLSKTKLRNYFQESYRTSINLISDEVVKIQLEQVEVKLIDLLRMYTEPQKCNVICHGDCWINNILFKTEGSKTDLCFVDFQAMRYANPLTDILYFLYICTDSEFRSQYFDELTLAYYETLGIFLKQYDIDANVVYPKENYCNDIQEMLPFGLLIALVELRIVTTCDDTISNADALFGSEEGIEKLPVEDGLLALRVNDVVNESIRNGVLQSLLNIANS